jgi:hypothetical protein
MYEARIPPSLEVSFSRERRLAPRLPDRADREAKDECYPDLPGVGVDSDFTSDFISL